MDYGALCLIPIAILLVTAIVLKDTFVSLLLGTISAFPDRIRLPAGSNP